MADAIPLVFNASGSQQYQQMMRVFSFVWVNAHAGSGSPNYQTDYGVITNNWALVLDRNDPTKPAYFNSALSSNTDVPAALADAVAKESLLFFSFAGYNQQVPQGALFNLLQENGAGGELLKLERLAYYHGCGMLWNSAYCLVSSPGTGLPGIEKSAPQEYGTSQTQTGPASPVSITFQTLLSLVPGPNGYAPMEIG